MREYTISELKSLTKLELGTLGENLVLEKLKKFGYDVKLNLNEVKATVVDGKTHVHLDIDADLEKDELTKILKSIGL